MQLTFILNTRAAYWANLKLIRSIDRKALDIGEIYYIFICIIKEQCSAQEERERKR